MTFSRRRLLAGLALCPLCAGVARADAAAHWSYEGPGGPQDWGTLSGDFKACAVGAQQSPVDLSAPVDATRSPLKFSWPKQAFSVVNNGHTIQANVSEKGGSLTLDGRPFELKQFHFHAPSEHALNGDRTAMEAHFVHAHPDGGLAVVGVFLKAGRRNADFAALMAAAPKAQGAANAPVTLTLAGLLPRDRARYRYEGSLTTPPCSEVVDWNVFVAPVEVAQADIDAFRALFPMNARPLQAVNRRFLLKLR